MLAQMSLLPAAIDQLCPPFPFSKPVRRWSLITRIDFVDEEPVDQRQHQQDGCLLRRRKSNPSPSMAQTVMNLLHSRIYCVAEEVQYQCHEKTDGDQDY
jgi:hypothetical protein